MLYFGKVYEKKEDSKLDIKIIKCHGSGNDFIMIDEMNANYGFTDEDRVELSKEFCNRDGLLGADGILFVLASDHADAQMRMFNPDGSEAEMCGNGLRCVVRYVTDLLNKDEVEIETMKATLHSKRTEDIFEGIQTYQVEISPVSFELASLPMSYQDKEKLIDEKIESLSNELHFTAISVPNPHLVTVVDKVEEEKFKKVAQLANTNKELLPKGVNVSFLKPMGESSIFVLTYERGVGFTNACGTAMSASSLVSCVLNINKIDKVINVYNKGGMVQCLVKQDDHGQFTIYLIGNATYTFASTITFDRSEPNQLKETERVDYEDEIALYSKLGDFVSEKINGRL